jgi:hypothetical protein
MRHAAIRHAAVSYFSTKLEQLMDGRRQQDVADASGLGRTSVSQYATDTRKIGVDALTQLLKAFPDQGDRFALIKAHLLDEIPKEEFDRVAIVWQGGELREDQAEYITEHDKAIDSALALLRQRAQRDDDLRSLLYSLERIVR